MKYLKKYNILESKRQYSDINNIISYVSDICGDEYSVLGDNVKDGRSKIEMRHNKCGHIWSPQISSFIYGGRRCPNCFGKRKLEVSDIYKRCKNLHGDEYQIIDIGNYVNNKSKITVRHNICSYIYDVSVQNLINKGSGCPKCSGKLKLSKSEISHRFKKVYGGDYDSYLDDDPKNGRSKIRILHKTCGNEWVASISNILYQNTGCPFCKISKGERMIKNFLDENNIEYKIQHRFPDCKYMRPLPFDFYIPDKRICIEYDGIQHFESIPFFGGDISLNRNRLVDDIKSNYCNENGIKLYRIEYKDKEKINIILDEIFKEI